MIEPYIPPWACRQWGQYEHDWLDCPDCCDAYETYNELHARLRDMNMANKVSYNDRLKSEQQVGMEETIASIIHDFDFGDNVDERIPEESAGQLGKDILYAVLREFRPDLFVDAENRGSVVTPDGDDTMFLCQGCRCMYRYGDAKGLPQLKQALAFCSAACEANYQGTLSVVAEIPITKGEPKTYRSSASNPNFTNIAKQDKAVPPIVRSVLKPRETVLIEVDQPKELGGPVAMAVTKDELPRKAPTFQFETDDGRNGVCHIFPKAQNKVHLQVTDRDGTEDAMVLSCKTFRAINKFVMGFDPGSPEGDKTVAMFCLPGDIQLPVTHVTALCTHLERLANEIKAAPHSDCALSILGRKIRARANLIDQDRGPTGYWVTGNEAPFSDPLDAILWAFRRPLDPRFYLTSAEEDSLRRLLPNGCTTHTLVVPDSQGKGGKKIVARVGKLLHLVVHEEWMYVEEVEGKKD